MVSSSMGVRWVISGSSTDTTRSKRFLKTCIPMRSDAYKLILKKFFILEDFHEFMEHHLPAVEQEVDGIILLRGFEPVRTGTHETMFKWKPRDKNTVDFRMERDGDTWRLYVQERGNPCSNLSFHQVASPTSRIGSKTAPSWSVNTLQTKRPCGGDRSSDARIRRTRIIGERITEPSLTSKKTSRLKFKDVTL